MSRSGTLLLSFVVVLCVVHPIHAAVIQTPFDIDLDSWTKLAGGDVSSFVEWVPISGNPDGFLRFHEVGIGFIDYVAAPEKFLEDKSAYYGGTLSFDIRIDSLVSPTNRNDQVRLTGAGLTLRSQLANPSPVNTWHRRFIDLVETVWVDAATGQPTSQSQMLQVLHSLSGLHLLADYRTGSEMVDYDNIRLIPLPSLPGDYNLNNIVDAADYVLWRKHLGTGFQLENEALGVTRGSVTIEDFDAWRLQFGNIEALGASRGNVAARVPEPATLPIIAGVAALLRRTARRRWWRR